MVPIDDFCQIKVVAMQFEIIWQKQVGYLHVFVKLNINAYLQAWRKLENSEGATWTERSEAASGREPGGGAKPPKFISIFVLKWWKSSNREYLSIKKVNGR